MKVSFKRKFNIGLMSLATVVLCLGVTSVSSAAAKQTVKIPVPAALKAALIEPTMAQVMAKYHYPALASTPPTGKNVYYIYSGLGPGQTIQASMTAAAKVLGWNFHVLTDNPANPATFDPLFLSAINAGANAIAYDGVDVSQIPQALALAKQDGVIITTHLGGDPETPANNALFNQDGNQQIDDPAIGKLSGEEIEQLQGKHANVAVIGTNGLAVINTQSELFIAGIKKGCPTCSVGYDDVSLGDFVSASTNADIVAYLRLHPKTTFVYFSYGLAEGNLRAALNNAGFRKVLIGGFSAEATQNANIADGADAFWGQDPLDFIGWLDFDTFARGFEGANAGIHNTQVAPIWFVTKKSLHFNVTTVPNWPSGYQKVFETLWKVS